MTKELKDGVLVIAIGGTIDSAERAGPRPTGPQKVTMLDKSLVVEYIKNLKENPPEFLKDIKPEDIHAYQNETFVDSADFKHTDLAKLAVFISEQNIKNVIITCGTDHMITLSQELQEIFKKQDKGMIIQVTGAMTPLANGTKRADGFETTDGYDNINYTLENVANKTMQPSVQIAFKDRKFLPDDIVKDYVKGEFLTKDEAQKLSSRFEGFVKFVEQGGDKGNNSQLIKK